VEGVKSIAREFLLFSGRFVGYVSLLIHDLLIHAP
jgi:hypothetical protein